MTPTTFANSRQGPEKQMFDTILLLLGAAADRDDRMLLPVPGQVTVRGIVLDQLLQSLLEQSLVEEVLVEAPEHTWRSDGMNRFGLRITNRGLKAVGYPALESGLAIVDRLRP